MKTKRLVILRRASQIFLFLFFIYILWSMTGPISPAAFFKIDPLITFFTSLSERILINGIVLSCVMIFFTLILGRFFCGWICPLGCAIDMAGCAAKGNRKEDDAYNAKHRKAKFFILAAIALFAVAGMQVAWIFDPIGIMARFVGPRFFSNSIPAFLIFALICALAIFRNRFWCRNLCPLGAIYAIVAKYAVLGRRVDECGDCNKCKSRCRMGAIRDDLSYSKGECILCMDCLYDCPSGLTKFTFGMPASKEVDTSRRNLILLMLSSVFLMGFGNIKLFARRFGRPVIRPPAALEEEEFVDRCIRCGSCMRVCITNGLHPVALESGLQGMWTPRLIPEIGYCDYNCTLCGNTCPTGAIKRISLGEKHSTKLGIAEVDRLSCIAWSENRECMTCEKNCPVPGKAIKAKRETIGGVTVLKPLVDGNLCVGCGRCQNKCPVRPIRAIKIHP